jgi:hypothetical protein
MSIPIRFGDDGAFGNELSTMQSLLVIVSPGRTCSVQREGLHQHGLEARVSGRKCRVTSYQLYVRLDSWLDTATPKARKQLEREL